MIIPESLTLPARSVIRRGAVQTITAEASRFGSRGTLVFSRSLERSGVVAQILAGTPSGVDVLAYAHPGGEPTLDQLAALLAAARAHRSEWIAAAGGGSAIDVAKACAGLFRGACPLPEYHAGKAVERPGIPFLAAPSTAGSGAEATPNSVLTDTSTGVKKSIRDDAYTARTVILDADLLATCPPAVIAHSGMDAFAQAVEAFCSRKASDFTDGLALQAASLLAPALPRCQANPGGPSSDAVMAGSYLAGLALANARLGLLHGIAHPLGSRYHVPHGHVCAVGLGPVVEFNCPALGARYERLCAAVGGDLVQVIHRMVEELAIRSPFAGQPMPDRARIIEETLASASTAANPRPVGASDVEALLARMWTTPGR